MDKEERYKKFSSTLSFFEFIQKEFYKPHFEVNEYKEEINELSQDNSWDVEKLSKKIRNFPKIFDVLEQIFQLRRFTNTQRINFLFDIETLNSGDIEKIKNYLDEILENNYFKKIFDKEKGNLEIDERDIEGLIRCFKSSIVKYIERSINDREFVYKILRDNKDACERLSSYVIDNLELNNILESIHLENYIKNKRIPKDTKSIHGKFGTIKLKDILDKAEIKNADSLLDSKKYRKIPKDLSNISELEELKGKIAYVSERYVEGINKVKQNKLKKFDFIIIENSQIKYVIETNFYSTSGTKIGINEEEYVDLSNSIKENHKDIGFIWVTDGNYWLSLDGEQRFKRDLDYFGESILNYNMFENFIQTLQT